MSNSKMLNSWVGSAFSRVAPTTSNLFRAFTPHLPMGVPGASREQRLIDLDVPPKLEVQLRKGMPLIGEDCLRENAVYVLGIYQNICLEHVLSMQVADRTLRRVLDHNPILESEDPDKAVTLTAESRIAKSSYLGQDPWGDKPLTKMMSKKVSKSKADSVGDYTVEDSDTEEGEVRDLSLNDVQRLMVAIQDKNYAYLTNHLARLLTPSMRARVWEKEQEYKKDVQLRASTACNRMPWAAYREAVLKWLPDSQRAMTCLNSCCCSACTERKAKPRSCGHRGWLKERTG